MAYLVLDGVATEIDTAAEIDFAIDNGHVVYGTLAGAVHHGGAVATPFDGPVRVELLYNSAKALGIGTPDGRPILEQVGSRATYKVIAADHIGAR